ncbi:hypothetical protein V5O48_004826 [Marasmius crinis-equi]|uniref:Uncharacterized protein n=1 Tax=Marasmius crinis-equi TaxID=585013 RepID=A0ABR3FNY5_9AGAR
MHAKFSFLAAAISFLVTGVNAGAIAKREVIPVEKMADVITKLKLSGANLTFVGDFPPHGRRKQHHYRGLLQPRHWTSLWWGLHGLHWRKHLLERSGYGVSFRDEQRWVLRQKGL